MNKKIGVFSSAINLLAVVSFAISMLLGTNFWSYLSSIFIAGLTVCVKSKADKWLKGLLLVHGVFFITCFILPMLGLFTPDMTGANWIGIAVLEFWCVYFVPIGILSLLHFLKCEK